MDTIEKAHAEVAVMVKAALDRRAFTAEEVLESVRNAYMAVLAEAEALGQYTCHVACDHGQECRTTRRAALRAQIDALPPQDGREPPQEEGA